MSDFSSCSAVPAHTSAWRHPFCVRARRSDVAALRWADVELADVGDVVVVTGPPARRGSRPEVIPMSGVDQVNRRFTAALRRGRSRGPQEPRTAAAWDSPSNSLPAGPPPTPSSSPAGWKDTRLVVRYAASVATRDGAVSRDMR